MRRLRRPHALQVPSEGGLADVMSRHPQQSRALRQALILQDIDFKRGRALVGTCHTNAVIAEALAGFAAAVRAVKHNGLA
jgi:hypothetical protein